MYNGSARGNSAIVDMRVWERQQFSEATVTHSLNKQVQLECEKCILSLVKPTVQGRIKMSLCS